MFTFVWTLGQACDMTYVACKFIERLTLLTPIHHRFLGKHTHLRNITFKKNNPVFSLVTMHCQCIQCIFEIHVFSDMLFCWSRVSQQPQLWKSDSGWKIAEFSFNGAGTGKVIQTCECWSHINKVPSLVLKCLRCGSGDAAQTHCTCFRRIDSPLVSTPVS